MDITSRQIALFLTGILVTINVGSAFVVWRDKRRAVSGQWRIREGTLLVWALFGGWPGGIWAMRRFRHKTSKPSFIARYVLATTLNLAVAAAIAYAVIS